MKRIISCSHSSGNTATTPSATSKAPETAVKTVGERSTNTVLTFRISVNRIIEPASDAAIIYGRDLSLVCPPREPPTITGSSGSTQGAKIVKTPAKKLMRSSNMYCQYNAVNA